MGRLMARGKNWCVWKRQEKTFPLLLGPNWPKGGLRGRECRSGLGRDAKQTRPEVLWATWENYFACWPTSLVLFVLNCQHSKGRYFFFQLLPHFFITDSEERKLNIKGCHSCQYMSIHMSAQGDPVRTKIPCLLVTGFSLNKGQIIYHLNGGPHHSVSSSQCFNQSKLHWLCVYTKIYENFCCVPNCTLLLVYSPSMENTSMEYT